MEWELANYLGALTGVAVLGAALFNSLASWLRGQVLKGFDGQLSWLEVDLTDFENYPELEQTGAWLESQGFVHLADQAPRTGPGDPGPGGPVLGQRLFARDEVVVELNLHRVPALRQLGANGFWINARTCYAGEAHLVTTNSNFRTHELYTPPCLFYWADPRLSPEQALITHSRALEQLSRRGLRPRPATLAGAREWELAIHDRRLKALRSTGSLRLMRYFRKVVKEMVILIQAPRIWLGEGPRPPED